MVLLAGLGVWGWQYQRNHLGSKLVLAALDQQIGAQRIHFTKVSLESVQSAEQERTYDFQAEGALASDLFLRKDTGEIVRPRAAEQYDRLEAVAAELGTEAGAKLLELAELGTPPADPLQLVFLEKTASAGLAIRATGHLVATRGPAGWVIEATPGEFFPAIPLGKPRAHQPEQALIVSDPTFEKTVTDAIGARLVFADQLEAGRTEVTARLKQEREARQAALLVALQPGALFIGKADPLEKGAADSAPGLVLEITSAKPQTRQVAVLLRNEGDWSDSRPFTGTWDVDDDYNMLRLTLATQGSQAVTDAGPQLADVGGWTINLELTPEGRLAGDSPNHHYVFSRVPSPQLEKTRTRLSAAHNTALAATAPDRIYQGTITAKNGGEVTNAILRFTRQDADGAKLEAELALVAQPNRKRTFRGFVAINPHRTGAQPLRLFSESRRRNSRAPSASAVGLAMDLAPAFAIRPEGLEGEDDYFVYSFSTTSSEAVEKIDAAHQSALAEIGAIVHPGSAYDGVARHSDGYTTSIRLRFTRTNEDGPVEAVIESLAHSGAYVYLKGNLDVGERTLAFTDAHGRRDTEDGQRFPLFLGSPSAATLHLVDGRITGRIDADPAWNLSFDLGAASGRQPAAWPAWPRSPGVYVLAGGSWQPLPADRGRTIPAAKAKGSRANNSDDPTFPTKVGELVFEGRSQSPEVGGDSPVVVVYVGTITPPSDEKVRLHPDALSGYPGIELTPMRKALMGGKRTAELCRVTPEIAGFPATRVAGTFATPTDSITVFTTNTALPGGFYALLANGDAFEIQVK